MELVLVELMLSVSIIKEVSSLYGFMYMLTLLVPQITPTVFVIPRVIPMFNGQQVSINFSIDVSLHTHTHIYICLCTYFIG